MNPLEIVGVYKAVGTKNSYQRCDVPGRNDYKLHTQYTYSVLHKPGYKPRQTMYCR